MNYWLFLEKSDETRVHNGIDSYKDETGKIYNYDSFVPNHLNIMQGDKVIFRVENDIIGIGTIEHITKRKILKIHRRCPKCDSTKIYERKTKTPNFACRDKNCKWEFSEPNITKDDAVAYTAEIIKFKKFELPPSVSDIKKCSITSNGQKNQNAMLQLDPLKLSRIINEVKTSKPQDPKSDNIAGQEFRLVSENATAVDRNMNDVNWRHFPSSTYPAKECLAVVEVIKKNQPKFRLDEKGGLTSDEVLAILREDLIAAGFKTEKSKRVDDKLPQVVTWGENGKPDKSFHVDAFHEKEGVVVEIEAGQAVANHRFLKDFFEACALQMAQHLVIVVRMDYKGNKDYATICKFFDSIYASNRMTFPLKGLLIIGYNVK